MRVLLLLCMQICPGQSRVRKISTLRRSNSPQIWQLTVVSKPVISCFTACLRSLWQYFELLKFNDRVHTRLRRHVIQIFYMFIKNLENSYQVYHRPRQSQYEYFDPDHYSQKLPRYAPSYILVFAILCI